MVAAAEVGTVVNIAHPRLMLCALLCGAAPVVNADAATYAFIVAGLGGEPQYEQRFRQQAASLATAAEIVTGDASHVVTLIGDRARRDSVRREIKALAARMSPADAVTIVLIGHGSFDGEEYRFNVPDVDLTASELGRLFDELPAKDQLVVNATSASGAIVERWQRPRRVVITATKSGGERNATRFAEHWAQAITTGAADVNKDEVVTAAEAFEYATRQVAATFKSDVTLATEHSRLEGDNAGRFIVARLGAAATPSNDPEVSAMLSQREQIERDLDAVKERKATLREDDYYDELEAVLVKLALLQKQIDARRGGEGASQ
jgi:hypothetical protein